MGARPVSTPRGPQQRNGQVRGSVRTRLDCGLPCKALDTAIVVPALRRLCENPATRPFAETSLEDIEHFIVKLKGKHKAKRLPADRRP